MARWVIRMMPLLWLRM